MEDVDPIVWSIGDTSALKVLGVSTTPPDEGEAGFVFLPPKMRAFELT